MSLGLANRNLAEPSPFVGSEVLLLSVVPQARLININNNNNNNNNNNIDVDDDDNNNVINSINVIGEGKRPTKIVNCNERIARNTIRQMNTAPRNQGTLLGSRSERSAIFIHPHLFDRPKSRTRPSTAQQQQNYYS